MGKLFGTDGVRGIANQELTPELAFQLGRVGAYVLTKEFHHKAKILVGRDTRISGGMLENALMAGICSVGAHGVSLGIVPTPAVAYLTRKYGADAGIVISASHNPVEYNGIKFFNNQGYKLRDELEEEIEQLIQEGQEIIPRPTGSNIGITTVEKQGVLDYIQFAKSSIHGDLKGLRMVIDCGNGASYITAKETLIQLGAEVIAIHDEPDGTNINKNCGSTHMRALIEKVKEYNVDLGLAFDGDADRCLAVDELGNIIDGDQIMAVCGSFMREQGRLKQDTIVATVMSNLGLHMMAKAHEIKIEQAQVGDRYVLEKMLQEGYNLGGEQSGHIIFLDDNTTGDGLVTALHLLEVVKVTGKKLSELAGIMEILPQVLVNAKVTNIKKEAYLDDPVITEAIQVMENKFHGAGRVLIRPSGTEPLVRVMLEGKNQEELLIEAKELAALIEERLQ